MGLYGLIFGALIFAAAAGCASVAVAVGTPPRSREYILKAATLGLLSGLAPIALVVFLRLSYKACVVANVFGLPWAEPWREIAHVGAGVLWVASAAFLVVALATPELRRAGVAMLIWAVAVALPTFFLLFLTVFGDPAANCTPV